MMAEYAKTDKSGNIFRTVSFGKNAFIERNQAHCPDDWFLVSRLMPIEKAIAKINSYCER